MAEKFDLQQALSVALLASDAASNILTKKFLEPKENLKTWMKAPGDLVTSADIEANDAILEILQNSCTKAGVLSEETGQSKNVRKVNEWLVDPLCGTVPYRSGLPHWGFNIALRRGPSIDLGIIALPAMQQLLKGCRETGLFLNEERYISRPYDLPLSEAIVGLEVDGGQEWGRLIRAELYAPSLKWLESIGQVNVFSSAAFPLAQMILGRLSAVVIYNVETVHVAAGSLISELAGATVTDGLGRPIDWSQDGPIDIYVAGWPDIHKQLIKII